MTEEQFEALTVWVNARVNLMMEIERHHNDGPRVARLRIEIADLDDEARAALVITGDGK